MEVVCHSHGTYCCASLHLIQLNFKPLTGSSGLMWIIMYLVILLQFPFTYIKEVIHEQTKLSSEDNETKATTFMYSRIYEGIWVACIKGSDNKRQKSISGFVKKRVNKT